MAPVSTSHVFDTRARISPWYPSRETCRRCRALPPSRPSDIAPKPTTVANDPNIAPPVHAYSPLEIVPQSPFHTGGAHITTSGATASLTGAQLHGEKTVYVLRHGLTTWNVEGRIQGSSNESELTSAGRAQAARCREALSRIPFDSCFHSPITRAATTAEIIWDGRQGAMIPLDSLREAHLGFFQGMRNGVLLCKGWMIGKVGVWNAGIA